MAIKKINNITIFADLGESVELPMSLPVIEDGVHVGYIDVDSWYPSTVDTSVPADLVFIATISGYPEKVICSVITDGIDENPP